MATVARPHSRRAATCVFTLSVLVATTTTTAAGLDPAH
jgi:hypothetical protein